MQTFSLLVTDKKTWYFTCRALLCWGPLTRREGGDIFVQGILYEGKREIRIDIGKEKKRKRRIRMMLKEGVNFAITN